MNSQRLTLLVGVCAAVTALLTAPQVFAGPPAPSSPAYQVPQWPRPDPGPVAEPGSEQRPPFQREAAGAAARAAVEINRHRGRAGCPRVRLRAALNRAAQAHSADMARHQRLGHTGTNGSSPEDRMRAAGYHPSYSGEAVLSGADTARGAVNTWMDSPPHRAIILTCRYRDAGIGRTDGPGGAWWTLDLASR
ncbi:CAP domain-containing protein [Streptomyces sp. NPDC127072]|uniref:CAP domain-containing protein n=1 Tax=Streptomyces sp. NPDC127072 TaxID=3347129 RepID=UPI003665C04F